MGLWKRAALVAGLAGIVLFGVIAVLSAVGQGAQKPTAASAPPSGAQKPAAAAVDAEDCGCDEPQAAGPQVWAIVNGTKVFDTDIKAAVAAQVAPLLKQ